MSNSVNRQKALPFFAGALTLFVLCFAYMNSHETALFDSEPTTVLDTHWTLQNADGGPPQPVTLPVNLNVEAGQPVTISCVLPDDLAAPVVLCFRSSQQRVRVICGGELIYSFGEDTALYPFGESPGSIWNLVRLAAGSEGQEVTIQLTSPYDSYSGRINTVYEGSKASLLFMLMREHFLSFALTLAIFICGIVLAFCHFIFLRKSPAPPGVLHLGTFALLVSGWMFGESKLVQFFIAKPLFALALTFICMLLLPIPMICYIRCIETFRYKRICSRVIALLYLQFIVVFLLQLFNVIDLIEILPVVHLVFLAVTLLMLALLLSDRAAHMQRASASVLVLLLFGVLETVVYYFPNSFMQTGVSLQLGMLLFIVIQARVARNHALYILRLSREATTDGLTGCQNRLAYSKRLQQLSLHPGLAAVVADMNDLKIINDTMGHAAGDEAILMFAHCFKQVFANFGDCYRIGGDEFVFISRIISDARLRELILKFEILCEKQSVQLTYNLEVAVGYAIYDGIHDHRASDLIRRADQAMYARKNQMKREQ